MSRSFWCWSGLCVALLVAAPAHARWFGRASKPASPKPAAGRTVMPLTPSTVTQQFAGKNAVQINTSLRAGRWTPDAKWLQTTGKRYGRLLVVSDLHISTGQDAVTRKVNPAEDFKPNLQEPDFRNMMQAQWQQAAKDGKVRTLVLNGDTLEFMQTVRPAVGMKFHGAADRYGPPNTPSNIIEKLDAISAGHQPMFRTFAEHLYRGNRLVFIPGNHDRQMLHPTVRRAFTGALAAQMSNLILADPAFQPSAGKHARKCAARQEADRLIKDRLEFHPWFFLVGDVLARHGNETDKYNSFSTPFGEYYHPDGKDAPLEAALGDYIVKGVFNKVERRKPWADNTSKVGPLVRAMIRAADYNPIKPIHFLSYLLTREGGPTSPRARARAEERRVRDVTRYVREFGLLDRFNALQPAGKHLTEEQLV